MVMHNSNTCMSNEYVMIGFALPLIGASTFLITKKNDEILPIFLLGLAYWEPSN